jgi:hypothetical protein
MIKIVVANLEKLSYSELGVFMESLLNIEYKASPLLATQIINELENRQKALKSNQETKESVEKFSIQEGIKIFRCIF